MQRIYVERPARDEFLERFLPKVEALVIGDPGDEATDVGPVIDTDARTRIAEWVEEAQAAGAKLLAGATDADPLGPIVLAEAPETARVVCDEVFGPVCVVNEAPTFRADQMPYGGVKDSGNTREGPHYAVHELTEEHLVVLTL